MFSNIGVTAMNPSLFYLNHFLSLNQVRNLTGRKFLRTRNWGNIGDIIIKNECFPVKWQKVKEDVGFSDFKEINDALTGAIDYPENRIKLNTYIETQEMLYPEEDVFSFFQVEDILNSLKFLGYKNLIIGPEFPETETTRASDEITIYSTDTDPSNLLYSKNIYTSDRKILFTTAFDLHYGFICSDREIIEKLVHKFQFEGFFCDQNTMTWWARINSKVEKME
ncbi:DUF2711 family protein [Adhaeribacter soli]|uniref:DUF2711 family protein n=1 Tax=Adhaeribacter soli TaxID=2607655 RepID=A0A5N1J519_9BACT|nr:DUF2711 family protein [Adhaeribacter soli]KAA9346011.1 DUF2711 family protein [Adhaeribacter soli]